MKLFHSSLIFPFPLKLFSKALGHQLLRCSLLFTCAPFSASPGFNGFHKQNSFFFLVEVLYRLNKILHLSHAGNCVTAQLWRLLRQSQHSDCIRVKQTAPTAFSLHSRRDTSQTSLMTFGRTDCWGIQNLWPGCGSSVLNTDLLLSPMMESVNLECWPNASVRMLLLLTEVSKLICKKSCLLVSNSDFHSTMEKKTQTFTFKRNTTILSI